MKIQKRKLNVKRHTIGYKVAGKWRTRKETYELAKQGKLNDVVACRGEYGGYIQSHPMADIKLYDIPAVVEK